MNRNSEMCQGITPMSQVKNLNQFSTLTDEKLNLNLKRKKKHLNKYNHHNGISLNVRTVYGREVPYFIDLMA